VRRLDPPEAGAARAVTTIAGMNVPPADGTPLPPGAFAHAWAIAIGSDGAAWVSDPKARRVTRIAAAGGGVQIFDDVAIGAPSGIAVAADGTVWLVDLYDGGVRTIAPDGTIAKRAVKAAAGALSFPSGIALDGETAWIIDSGHRTIHRLDADGTLTTLAGGNVDAPFVDGDGRRASLEPLVGLAKLGDRWLIADAGNYRIRALTPGATAADTRVASFAGRAQRLELIDAAGPESAFAVPTGLAVDTARQIVYVSDSGNSTIRALTP
jgi:sugar lactone lactonase YvrE